MSRLESFKTLHPTEYQWLVESAPAFPFARSLLSAVAKYGSLTPNQIGAIHKCLNRKPVVPANIDVSAIADAFARALASGVKKPSLRLDRFKFSLAPSTGKNPNAVYVKEGDTYLGKVVSGQFFKVRACSDEAESAIIACASDPKNSATAYGRKFGVCSACGLTLSREDSIARNMGAICAKRYGWSS